MSTVMLILDKPRTLTYRWTDMRTITQRLGGCTMIEFLQRLGNTQPDVLHTALLVGLSNDDAKLTGKRLDDLIQSYIDRGGKLGDLVNAVLEALQEDGLLYADKKKTEGSDSPNPTPS